MNKTAKRFCELAQTYEKTAFTLWQQIISEPDTINPTVYLLRHSVELYLKGLIIEKAFNNNLCTEINEIEINGSGRMITSVHSLLNLWNYYKRLSEKYMLTPGYSPGAQKFIDFEILYWNGKDPRSTSFRYPFEKDDKPIPIKLISLDDSGKVPEIKCAPPRIMAFGPNVFIVKKGYRYLTHTQNLFGVAEILSRLFEP